MVQSSKSPIQPATRLIVPWSVPVFLRSCRTARTTRFFSACEYRRVLGLPGDISHGVTPSSFPKPGASSQARRSDSARFSVLVLVQRPFASDGLFRVSILVSTRCRSAAVSTLRNGHRSRRQVVAPSDPNVRHMNENSSDMDLFLMSSDWPAAPGRKQQNRMVFGVLGLVAVVAGVIVTPFRPLAVDDYGDIDDVDQRTGCDEGSAELVANANEYVAVNVEAEAAGCSEVSAA